MALCTNLAVPAEDTGQSRELAWQAWSVSLRTSQSRTNSLRRRCVGWCGRYPSLEGASQFPWGRDPERGCCRAHIRRQLAGPGRACSPSLAVGSGGWGPRGLSGFRNSPAIGIGYNLGTGFASELCDGSFLMVWRHCLFGMGCGMCVRLLHHEVHVDWTMCDAS